VRIGIPRERGGGERRVALTPAVVTRLAARDLHVVVEAGAGAAAGFGDAEYRDAGAEIGEPGAADLVALVGPPGPDDLDAFSEGTVILGFLAPFSEGEIARRLVARRLTAHAFEAMPRTTLAQAVDALSSQATAAGYAAGVLAASVSSRIFPMLTTAAGTVRPVKVVVLGAGVAGLQAIATCRRLGAVVAAYDLRPEAHDEISSLGARAIEAPLGETTEAGYAKETTEEFARRQLEALTPHVAAADVVITAAQVPGRPAPRLLTREMVETMNPAAVIVDMAAADGGNCELSRPGETTEHGGVHVFAPLDLPSRVARDASQLYARNVQAFAELLVQDEPEAAAREILESSRITHEGEVVHPITRELLGGEVTS
jgi:H+-translocating NAD(P) transhydrogenase subunit alpha